MIWRHESHGLSIESFLELTGFARGNNEPDIKISRGKVPIHFSGPEAWSRACFRSTHTETLLDLTCIGAGRILARDGKEIIVGNGWSSKTELLQKVLAEDLLAAVLMHRRTITFFGTALSKNGVGYLLLGPSAIGKSTLAAHLCEQGFSLLADGLCTVRKQDNEILLLKGNQRLKLWGDAIERLGWDTSRCRKVRASLDKYFAPEGFSAEAEVPASKIFIMTHEQNASHESLLILRGSKALQRLTRFVASPTAFQSWFIPVLGPMVNQADLQILEVPRTNSAKGTINEMVERVTAADSQ